MGFDYKDTASWRRRCWPLSAKAPHGLSLELKAPARYFPRLTGTKLCETIRPRQREVEHEIPNRDVGGCWLSRCERVGGSFLCEKQGPSHGTAGVHARSFHLPCCDNRHALPGQRLFGCSCERGQVSIGWPSSGNPAATSKAFRLNSRYARHDPI